MSCDLELEISSGAARCRYLVTADSPAGTASGQLWLDVDELSARRRELASAVLASAVPTRSGLSAQELPVREVGQLLFNSVFAERVYGRYTASVQEAARRGEPLRLVLRLRASELAALPWETMFDAEADEYLCQREPIVRYVETAQPATPLQVNPPLRILGLVSAPRDLPKLDVAEEQRRLTDAIEDLRGRRQVELTWASAGTWPSLQEALLDGSWHVLHFIGHGGIDRDMGVLALEDELTGQTSLVSSARFARLLHACRPVPRLVVLNSCQSGEAAADDLLSSTAAELVHSGISAVVAMQFVVTDPAALAFSRGFYRAIAHNQPVDEAVRLGRIAIDGTSENTLEWVTPVLFLRTDETRLFSVIRPDDGEPPTEPKQPPPEPTLQRLYIQALAAMRTGRHADAITLLDSLLALDPSYRDAADQRDAARRNQHSATCYQRARAAEAVGNWDSAIAEYAAITEPGYRDVAKRLAHCTAQRQIAGLHEELRAHLHASEWVAVIAVGEDLAALGLKSAEVSRAIKTAREQIRRGDRFHRDQPVERHFVERNWKILYAPHFPVLGSAIILWPLLTLALHWSGIIEIFTSTPYWVMMILGLAGIVGSAIDYRNGCGVSAVAIGVNSAWLAGYAVFLIEFGYWADVHHWLDTTLFTCAVAGIGIIGNGMVLIYIFRRFQYRRKITIDKSLIMFLIFTTAGLAFFSIAVGLASTHLLWTAGAMFWAALLAELTGIVLAFIRVARPGG
jgi:hypothetical protein